MLTSAAVLLIPPLAFGFALGYLARELKSRRRYRLWREKHWYGR